jgi:hypothetical protein
LEQILSRFTKHGVGITTPLQQTNKARLLREEEEYTGIYDRVVTQQDY